MEFKVDSELRVKLYSFENANGLWIKYSDFKTLIISGIKKYDKQEVHRSNLSRDTKKLVKNIELEDYLTISDFIQYVYNNRKWTFCTSICNIVETKLKFHSSSSILDLYKVIAHEGLFLDTVENFLFSLDVDLSSDTLINDYCDLFSTVEWKRICLFEYHFNCLHDSNAEQSYEDKLSRREEYFEQLRTVSGINRSLEINIKHCINVRKNRADEALRKNEVNLIFSDKSLHIPAVIEKDIVEHIVFTLPGFIGRVFCFDCSEECKTKHSNNCIHVVIEVKGVVNTEENLNFLTVVATKCVERHNIPCVDNYHLLLQMFFRLRISVL